MPVNLPTGRSAIARYPLNQCALYKLESKRRLAALLHDSLDSIRAVVASPTTYRVFEQPEKVCEFTGKLTKARWVQEPLGDLKRLQSRIAKLLARVELPSHCHGAAPGRSYRSNAAAHVDGICVATFDLKTFFPSTKQSSVYWFFRHDLLCSHDVSELLVGLTCRDGELPTGSPSSPILSFYANRRMFEALNRAASDRQLVFTAYIDDLTFSGDFIPGGFDRYVKAIVESHGHRLSVHKSKIFPEGTAKHVTGTVIHEGRLKVPHVRFQKARAIASARRKVGDAHQRLQLSRKLAGLAGEAAFLDPAFRAHARHSYQVLAKDAKQVADLDAGLTVSK